MKLTSHEFRVLSYLMHHRGRVVSQSELTEHIYAQDFDRDSNTVEVFIARLRRKLGASFIETVRGLGYRIAQEAPMTPAVLACVARVLLGAALWTVGLFAVSGAIADARSCFITASAPKFFHDVFAHVHGGRRSWRSLCMVAGLSQVRRGLVARQPAARAAGRGPPRAASAGVEGTIRPRCSRSSTISTRCSSTASRRSRARSPRPATSRTD